MHEVVGRGNSFTNSGNFLVDNEHGFKELFLCFQKLVSGELHTFFFWEVSQTGDRNRDLGVRHPIASST